MPRGYPDAIVQSNPREYAAWVNMRHRCHNPRNKSYPYYGGRGIAVCEQWRTSFAAFITDVGPRPSPRHTLDRIDNAGDYEPGNVRWATWKEQRANRRPMKPYRRRKSPPALPCHECCNFAT